MHRRSFVREGSFLENNQNRLLASLTAADWALLKRSLHEVPLIQGEMLKEAGRPVDAVYFPLSGMVSLIVEMPEDRSIEVGTIGSEAAVGLAAGLGSGISSIGALVQVSGTSLCIPASRFRTAAAQSQHIRDLIIRYVELQMGQIQRTAACNALHDVGPRLARWILQTNDKIGNVPIPFTQEFLGKMLGVQRGTISGAAAKLEAGGLIHTNRGQIEVRDRDGLKKEACSCYEFVRRHIDRLVPRNP